MSTNTTHSKLQQARQAFVPPLPSTLAAAPAIQLVEGPAAPPAVDADRLAALFPKNFHKRVAYVEASPPGGSSLPQRALRVGCVLSGGQAPGGHNVIAGLYDYIKRVSPDSILYGFLDGPRGLFSGKYVRVDDALMNQYRNMGGFDMIGSGRDKIETAEQFAGCVAVADELDLDGVIIIGGDDSNTNAAVLAENFAARGAKARVIGCPKTIDGDLRVPGAIDISFGFDTACKIYSELIGNVCIDAAASGKYYYFIRLMGRAASNITLECALQTHPNVTLLGEEVAARKQNLASITEDIVHVIVDRWATGKAHGVVLVPEGLIEFVPEMNALLQELNDLLAGGKTATVESVSDALSANNAALFAYLPASIQKQLLADRDPHGNVQVSLIETEKLLAELVTHELDRLRRAGKYDGPFSYQCMFFGYEGRCGLPSDFDTAYCYALGFNAGALLHGGETGLISSVTNLGAPVEQWRAGGVPLTSMMNIERRHGKDKPVIRKALVELGQLPYRTFLHSRNRWAVNDCYRCPGPVQLDLGGAQAQPDGTHVDPLCMTLALELEERKTHGLPSFAPPPAAPDLAAYTAVTESLLRSGEPATKQDIHRLHLYRLSHSISDADHLVVLAGLGISANEWKETLNRIRREEGSPASPHLSRSSK